MNQSPPMPGTPKEILRGIRILFAAIIAGAVIFSVIVIVLNAMEKTVSPLIEYENIILVAGIAIALICLIIAGNGYNKGVTVAKDSLISLPGKLNQYRSSLILYIALCEGPALLGIILFFLTGNYLFFIITVIMLGAMLAKIPSKKRVADNLGLDWQQQQELE
jgi:hypothetical protein